jgi:hypothetical protein
MISYSLKHLPIAWHDDARAIMELRVRLYLPYFVDRPELLLRNHEIP